MSHVFWSIVLVAGVFLWIGATLACLFKAFPERGVFDKAAAAPWALASLVSFCVWVFGMLNA